jgi:hypothetical protein
MLALKLQCHKNKLIVKIIAVYLMSNTPNNTSEANNKNDQGLDGILKQAEKLEVQLNASKLFKKNTDYFMRLDANKYGEYINNYVPTNYQLLIDQNNQFNIIDLKSKNLIYNKNPKIIAMEQVVKYAKEPHILYNKIVKSHNFNKKWLHNKILHSSIDKFEALNIEKNMPSLDKIGFMVALGCGLGYQFSELINSYDIQHLFIYDYEKDFFYASLYTTDWSVLSDYFAKKKGTFVLHIGNAPQHTVNDIIQYRTKIGFHNVINTHFFTHFLNANNIEFNKRLRTQFSIIGGSIGFSDDERTSLAHTVYNLNKNHPLLIQSKKEIGRLPPVIMIANGPSLDTQIEFIKQNANKAILVSCGSAIGTLYNLGIKPDIHIEMERSFLTAQNTDRSTDLNYTKDITLVCLNTVAPKTLEKFKNVFIATKANDIGSEIILSEFKDQDITILNYCNPTVSNAGLAIICTLGFKEVYLTGTDFGMVNKDQHHAKNSVFIQKLETHTKNSGCNETEGTRKKKAFLTLNKHTLPISPNKIQGNFCNEVFTTPALINSKRYIEILLRNYPHVLCINSCNGAFIEGTITKKVDDLKINSNVIDKERIINKVLENNFYTPTNTHFSESYIKNKYFFEGGDFKKEFTLNDQMKNTKTLYNDISIIFAKLKVLEMNSPVMYRILSSSIEMYLGVMYSYCIRAKTNEEFKECYKIGKEKLSELVGGLIEMIENKLFELDDTIRKID